MKKKQLSAEEQFDSIVKLLTKDSAITKSKMFGSIGLKVNGKIFAMLVKGKLVVKLPKARVDALISEKKGNYFGHIFAPSNWRPMKEWVEIESGNKTTWLKLAKDAKKFVKSSLLNFS